MELPMHLMILNMIKYGQEALVIVFSHILIYYFDTRCNISYLWKVLIKFLGCKKMYNYV